MKPAARTPLLVLLVLIVRTNLLAALVGPRFALFILGLIREHIIRSCLLPASPDFVHQELKTGVLPELMSWLQYDCFGNPSRNGDACSSSSGSSCIIVPGRCLLPASPDFVHLDLTIFVLRELLSWVQYDYFGGAGGSDMGSYNFYVIAWCAWLRIIGVIGIAGYSAFLWAVWGLTVRRLMYSSHTFYVIGFGGAGGSGMGS